MKAVRKVALGALAIFSCVVLSALMYLHSQDAQNRIRLRVEKELAAAFQGRLSVERVEIRGTDVQLFEVTLYDPDALEVAKVHRLGARVLLLPLLHRELALQNLRLDGFQLLLREDARGLNLTRALNPKSTSGSSSPTQASAAFHFSIRQLQLSGGMLELSQEEAGQEVRTLRVESIACTGALDFNSLWSVFTGNLELQAQLTVPTQGPISLRLRSDRRGLHSRASLALHGPGADVDVRASGESWRYLRAQIKSFDIGPSLARAFFPSYPLAVPVSGDGTAEKQDDAWTAHLALRAAQAKLTLDGNLDTVRWQTEGVTLKAEGVDLHELFGRGPRSALAGEVFAKGKGDSWKTFTGELTVRVPAARLQNQTVGPVHIQAKALHGRMTVSELQVHMPGVNLTGQGEAAEKRVSFHGQLLASDLSQFAKTLGHLANVPPPPLTGRGELTVAAGGSFRRPTLSLAGQLPSFSYAGQQVQKLSLFAQFADLRHPLAAQVQWSAERLVLGERTFRDLHAKLTTQGRALLADFRTRGMADVLAHLAGTVDRDWGGLSISELKVTSPQTVWKLESPTHVQLHQGEVRVEPLTFVSGLQRVSLEGTTGPGRLRAFLWAQNVDIARLPTIFVNPAWNAGGLVNLYTQLGGTPDRPSGEVQLDVSSGRFRQLTGFNGHLRFHFERERATGTLRLQSDAGDANATFDLPWVALLQHRREPLELEANVRAPRLGNALAQFGLRADFDGSAAGALTVSGNAAEPKVELTVRAEQLRSSDWPVLTESQPRIEVRVASENNGQLKMRLAATSKKGEADLSVHAPFTAGELWKALPTNDALRQSHFETEANFHQVDVRIFHELGLIPEGEGQLSGKLRAAGSLNRPSGSAEFLGDGLGVAGIQPAHWNLRLEAAERVDLRLEVDRQGKPVLDCAATVDAPLSNLLSAPKRGQARLAIQAHLGSTSLAELLELGRTNPEERLSKPPDMSVLADLNAAGTLANPRFELHSELADIHLGQTPLGKANLRWTYERALSSFEGAFDSTGGGTLQVQGKAQLDLSSTAFEQGLHPKDASIQGRVEAKHFDVSVFSGLIPEIRKLGGVLRADGVFYGTLGAPGYRGGAEWTQGRLDLLGYGEYRNIHLAVQADTERIAVSDLSAQSGTGKLHLTANAVRSGEQFQIKGQLESERFPVVSDDQQVASVTLRSTLNGQLSKGRLDLQQVSIPEARIDLPEVRQKDLQPLDRPKDVVLVRNGRPVIAKARAKAAEESGGMKYFFTLDAPQNIWVKGTDINTEVGLSPGFRVEAGETTALYGDIQFLGKGRVLVFGRKFEIQKDSQIRFDGAPGQPIVNLTGVYTNEREAVTVRVAVTGVGKDLQIKPTSEPQLSDSEIYTLLATGRRTLKTGSSASLTNTDAASVVGSYVASELQKTFATKLPLDVLSVEAGEQGVSSTKVEAGTYVSDKVYIGYTGRLGANPVKENSNEVRLEYQFSPHWSFESEFGDARVGGADVFWRRDF